LWEIPTYLRTAVHAGIGGNGGEHTFIFSDAIYSSGLRYGQEKISESLEKFEPLLFSPEAKKTNKSLRDLITARSWLNFIEDEESFLRVYNTTWFHPTD
jgi:hypothetical protein